MVYAAWGSIKQGLTYDPPFPQLNIVCPWPHYHWDTWARNCLSHKQHSNNLVINTSVDRHGLFSEFIYKPKKKQWTELYIYNILNTHSASGHAFWHLYVDDLDLNNTCRLDKNIRNNGIPLEHAIKYIGLKNLISVNYISMFPQCHFYYCSVNKHLLNVHVVCHIDLLQQWPIGLLCPVYIHTAFESRLPKITDINVVIFCLLS